MATVRESSRAPAAHGQFSRPSLPARYPFPMSRTALIPTMFHRRLALLGVIVAAGLGGLGVQVMRLTVVHGAEHRERAESRLVRQFWTPTIRGKVVDRKGRVLAQDRPSFDIAVDYRVITGQWARTQASSLARSRHRRAWPDMNDDQRAELTARYQAALESHIDAMWRQMAETAGIDPEELARRRQGVIDRVMRMHEHQTRVRFEQRAEELRARNRLTPQREEALRQQLARQELAEQRAPHVLIPRATDAVGFAFLRLAEQHTRLDLPDGEREAGFDSLPRMPGLRIIDVGDRVYPFEEMAVDVDLRTLPRPLRQDAAASITVTGLACHILGWMGGEAQKDDVDRRTADLSRDESLREWATVRLASGRDVDRGRYMAGDVAGRGGLELARESRLRGLRGLTIVHVDTGEEERLDPVPGRDVQLSIDIMLQARVQAAMSPDLGLAVISPWQYVQENPVMPPGTPLTGAAVVLDIDTGEILAMVSTPTFTRQMLREKPSKIFGDDVDMMHLNKAIARPYPPGSIAKALTLAGAVTQGNYTAGQEIDCNGHLLANRPDLFRCWIYKQPPHSTHNARFGRGLNSTESMMVSCNIFYYTLGRRLGADGFRATFARIGFGQPLNLGIGMEFPGVLGGEGGGGSGGSVGGAISVQEATLIGIGQGPVSWTPLHAANTYAILARGGVQLDPHIVLSSDGPPEPRETGLSSVGAALALEGLAYAVNDPRGTGHHLTFDGRFDPHFNIPGVDLWGKTGTADPGPVREGSVRAGDHSWFVVMAGPEGDRPRFAIAVVMEYAGSGGKVSGPIASQILRALIAEGYLKPVTQPGT